MANFNATHQITCSILVRGNFNNKTGMFDMKACGRKFKSRASSDRSQEDANNQAEAAAQKSYNIHVGRAHK